MLFNRNDRIEKYVVAFPHRQGAYAETYRVKDGDGKTYFLKLINCSKLDRSQVDDDGRVLEVEIAKQLRHHNLCRYINSGSVAVHGQQYVWFVTEFVSGETLSQRLIRNADISVYEIKTVAKAVLAALSFLHSLPTPIIHNEVTTQNVLLNLTAGLNDLKLIDFGYAQYLNRPLAKPLLNLVNPFYLAPERFAGTCSVQSDLYAVGVLIYQLLYGMPPWFIDVSRRDSDDVVEAVLKERDKELQLPKVDKFDLDDQLLNCIAKALSYDVEERFQTAEDFIKGIDGEVVIGRQCTRRRAVAQSDGGTANSGRVSPVKEGEGFAAIAGMQELKQQLQEEVIEPLHNPGEYKRYGVSIPNGMLLYGPPGCGKTFFAKHFAEEVGFNFMFVTPATLKSRYVNATQENIAKMFAEAEKNAPTIIFIDEMNELVPDRECNVHEMSRSAVNEMLAQMDRTGERGIFVIGATNFPHTIDPAILRAGRIEKKYFLGAPDREARAALFRLYLKDRPYDFGLDYERLSDLTNNYVSADIQLIVNDAARKALKLRSSITMDLLQEAIQNTQPSLTAQELKRYDEIRMKMQGEELPKKENTRPRVGFR